MRIAQSIFCKAIALVALVPLRENPRAMQRFGVRQRPMLVTTLAISLAAPLAIWMLSPWRPSQWLTNRLYAEMERADEDHVDLPAQQLASVGEAGWGALVRGLQSNRPIARAAALRTIEELIDSWQRLPAEMSASRVTMLARLLAENLATADSEAMQVFADLAERLLAWPGGGDDGLHLVYDCEQVLRAARRAGWPRVIKAEPAPSPPLLTTHIPEAPTISKAPPSPVLAAAEELPDSITSREDGPAGSIPQEVTTGPEVQSLGLQPSLPLVLPSPEVGQLTFANEQPAEEQPLQPPSIPPPDWPTLGVDQVLRHWRDARFATEAEAELRRRKFDELNLRVARTASDADPEARMKLIRLLPELSGVNATGWLLVLARDESPRVRAAAIQVLSTATDPRIHLQLRKLEETETDASVRAALRDSGTTAR